MTTSGINPDFAYVQAPFQKMEAVVCPICGAAPDPFAVDPDGFQLCRCPRCALEFLNPRPTLDELRTKLYVEEYIPEEHSGPEYVAKQRRQLDRQLGALKAWTGKPGRVLDVGCGDGRFLAFAQQQGWECTGIDIHLYQQARALACRLLEGQLTEVDLAPHSFEAIRFSHVLEHTQNPLAELRRCRQLLIPDGILFISVPNLAGISSRLKSLQSRYGLKSRPWRHYAATHHLWYFTPASLAALAERADFRTLHWETPVDPKIGRGIFAEKMYRWLLEKPRLAGVLDAYFTPRP